MSIPDPEAGLVISYSYLWHHEHDAGRDEGRKNRPSVIVVSTVREADGAVMVTVLPITHTPPANAGDAVEIPPPVKTHLGLDDERSWVMVNEGNRFEWPGYDLRLIPGTGRHAYGFLPPRLFNQIAEAFRTHYRAGRLLLAPRD